MILKLIRTYIKFSSSIAPKRTGRRSFGLFQKVRLKNVRNRERAFFDQANHFTVPYEKEAIDCYEMGNPHGKLIILVHGWESNAGSLSKFAIKLGDLGYRVVTFNLPAHAFHTSKSTNLLECYTAMKHLLDSLHPSEPFSVISHSLGSAVTANALSRSNYKVDKLVFLSSLNRVEDIFEEFKELIGLNQKAYNSLIQLTTDLLQAPLSSLNVDVNVSKINYNQFMIIHDKKDRILSYDNAEKIKALNSNTTIVPIENVGHYKMLWSDQVVEETINFIEEKHSVKEAIKPLAHSESL